MSAADHIITLTRESRLSPYAMSAVPAWLWALDATRVIWSNATAATVLGATTPAELAGWCYARDNPVAADIARLAESLPSNGAQRFERVRDVGTSLVCTCARVMLTDGTAGVLVVASEPARRPPPLAARAEKLFAPGSEAVAVFAADGKLIYATGELDSDTTLATLGAQELQAEALANGQTTGASAIGTLMLTRIGAGRTTVLVASLPAGGDIAEVEAPEPPANPEAAADAELASDIASADAPPPEVPPAPEVAPPKPAEAPPSAETRPVLTVVPAAPNVVPFRSTVPAEKRPALTPVERSAFQEIAETLGKGTTEDDTAADPELASQPVTSVRAQPAADALPSAFARMSPNNGDADQLTIIERLPVGVLIHRDHVLIHANRAFLEWTGFTDVEAVTAAGGLDRLTVEPGSLALDRANNTGKTFTLATRNGDTLTCEGRLLTVPWAGENALMLVLIRTAADEHRKTTDLALQAAEDETRELKSILDTATDGVVVVDRDGLVLALNRSAEALFGYEHHEMARRPFTELFAPESERAARDYLDGLTKNGVASLLNDGREVIGRVRQGGLIPLFMTMGRVGDGENKFCAVLRDITQWKRAEEDLVNAKRTAERASSAKSDFLAKISHEIRTPLNAILGFSAVMLEERMGAIGSERYREYMRDIHASGEHLVSLINDLLDLSKIEAGKFDLEFASVNLNALIQQCVALMQPQANQQRIIIRSSLSPTLPLVVADARSVRQIVLNLLSNSIKFTGAGGQVIVSTALTDRAEAVLRVRDTGAGMTDKEIETAMEPFRQLATSTRWGSGGTGLGLPLTKALAEANRAAFTIKSARDAGTLVEITFSGARVLAE
jgi:PAS domain S-box-containing protein